MLVALMAIAMLAAVSAGAVIVNSDSYYYGLDTTTDVSTVTGSNAFATDFDEGLWSIAHETSPSYIRVPQRTYVKGEELQWELKFNLVPGRTITSVSIADLYFQVGSSSYSGSFRVGLGYVDSQGQDVVLKEIVGINSNSVSTTFSTQLLPQAVGGMTSLTLFGYVRATANRTNISGQIFQFGRGYNNTDDFKITINTVPEPATCMLLGIATLGVIARRRRHG
jgi:hypothetical protein